MVELKIDPEKLPKAEDLRSRYFLSTIAIAVNDDDVRLVTRDAFLSQGEVSLLENLMKGVLPAIQAARAAAQRAEAAKAEAAAAQAPAGAPGAGAGGPGRPGPGGPGMPARAGGRRGRGG